MVASTMECISSRSFEAQDQKVLAGLVSPEPFFWVVMITFLLCPHDLSLVVVHHWYLLYVSKF